MRKIAEFQFGTNVLEIRYRFVISTVAPRFKKYCFFLTSKYFKRVARYYKRVARYFKRVARYFKRVARYFKKVARWILIFLFWARIVLKVPELDRSLRAPKFSQLSAAAGLAD